MKWNQFEETNKELPEVVVEKMIEGFSNATKDLAELSISVVGEMARLTTNLLKTRFQFRLNLTTQHLPDYSFKVLEFGYDVSLYPVKVIIANAILLDLNSQGEGITSVQSFADEETLQKALKLVFESKKFNEIVSGLMKIARKNADHF